MSMNFFSWMRLGIFSWVALTAAVGWGQSAFSEHKEADFLPESTSAQETKEADLLLVVSATKGLELDPLDIPQSVNVISGGEVQSTVYTSASQALRELLPNVNTAQSAVAPGGKSNTTSNYFSEGFSIRGLGGARVLTLTDGVRQVGNGIGYGGGNLALYDLFSIEKFEVIRGPASVMYGTDAIGGVVNIITRSPVRREALGYKADLMAAYDGARRLTRGGAYLDVGDKGWGLLLGGGYTKAEIPRLPSGQTALGGSYKAASGWSKLDFYLSEKARLRFIGNITHDTDITAINKPIAFGKTFNLSIPLYQRSLLGVEMEAVDLNSVIQEVNAGLYWQQLRRKSRWSNVLVVGGTRQSPILNNSVLSTNDTVNTFEFQPYMRMDFAPHLVTLGMDIGLDTVKFPEVLTNTSITGASTATPILRAKAHQWRVGVYAQDNWKMEVVDVTIGGRADWINVDNAITNTKKNTFGLSGSLGLVHHIDEVTSLYGNIATGFRAPDLSERFENKVVPFFHLSKVMGNVTLSPERSYNAEIGIKRHAEVFQFEVAGFVNQIHNYIGLKAIDARNGIWQYSNLGIVTLYGAEAGVVLFPDGPWQTYVNGGRTYSSPSSKSKIALPAWTVNFGTLYNINTNRTLGFIDTVTPELIVRAATRSYDSLNKVPSPGFIVFNAQLTLTAKETKAAQGSLIVGVSNIFNITYMEPFFAESQPARGFFVTVQLSF